MSDETFIDVIRRAREPGAAPSQKLRMVPEPPPAPPLNTHALAVQAGIELAAEMASGRPRRDEAAGDVELNAEDDES